MTGAPLTADVVRRLRAAYASTAERASDGECPEPERIWEAVQGQLPPGHVTRLLDHALVCSACDRAFVVARELSRQLPTESIRPAPAVFTRGRPTPMRRWMLAGGGAAAALAAVAFFSLRPAPAPVEPAFRESPSAPIAALGGTERLPRDRCLLRWSAGPPGTRYSLWVATPELRELYVRPRLEAPEQLVPASALQSLPSGAEFLWRVEAQLPDGRRLSSQAFRTRVE